MPNLPKCNIVILSGYVCVSCHCWWFKTDDLKLYGSSIETMSDIVSLLQYNYSVSWYQNELCEFGVNITLIPRSMWYYAEYITANISTKKEMRLNQTYTYNIYIQYIWLAIVVCPSESF